ncbi:MAG: peptidoglycan DD-metalloendopeptidase family protein [Desulfobulbaceae bacterium]|nr:peptidoglycan DD-metalloendopeptidase family protein [Desulfobulbaceae bacterium]
MICRFTTAFLPVLLAAAILTANHASASDTDTSPADKIDKPIKRYEKNIQKLQSGIEIHLGKLQISSEKEFSLLEDIESIDKKLALQKIRVAVMEERLESQTTLLEVKIRELHEAQVNREKISSHLLERLRAFYLTGKTGILNVTFSDRTLPELMLFNDSFQNLLSYDRELIEHYRETIAQLELAKESHEQESILLDRYIQSAREEKKNLDSIKKEKEDLLRRVKSEKALYEQALSEMKTAESNLLQSLLELQEKKTYLQQGFVMNKGKMLPPVAGRVVSLFGESHGDVQDQGTGAMGITIDAENGAPLKSIFDGKVIFAGYKRGYGNMVIIDHGMNYYTITSRMEKISVTEGDIIDEGAVIGQCGDIATLFEKGLYFEIRHNTDPVDPLEWISKKGLTGL